MRQNGCIQQPRKKGHDMTDDVDEGSAAMRGSVENEPVAWAVVLNAIEAISMNGGEAYRVTASKEEADRIAAHAMAVVPLYPHPPQKKVVRLPSAFNAKNVGGWAMLALAESLNAAGVEWEVAEE
jgi:hypothetical protein